MTRSDIAIDEEVWFRSTFGKGKGIAKVIGENFCEIILTEDLVGDMEKGNTVYIPYHRIYNVFKKQYEEMHA